MYTVSQIGEYETTYATREDALKAIQEKINSYGSTYYLLEVIEAYKAEDKPLVVVPVNEAIEALGLKTKEANKLECISWD